MRVLGVSAPRTGPKLAALATAAAASVFVVTGSAVPASAASNACPWVGSSAPIKALAQVLEDAYTPAAHAFPAANLSILLAWAVAGGALAAWRFRRQTA